MLHSTTVPDCAPECKFLSANACFDGDMADDNLDDLLKQVQASLGSAAPDSVPTEQNQVARQEKPGLSVGRVVGGLVAGAVAGIAVWLVLTLASTLVIPAVLVAFVATTIAWIRK